MNYYTVAILHAAICLLSYLWDMILINNNFQSNRTVPYLISFLNADFKLKFYLGLYQIHIGTLC